ncbi:C-terminal binding protein [Halobacteriales archaeon QS_1_68_17]|nr:MAG: C-terminal binding protein [Halobacteriales archaeon QS_1_68_17]
MQYTVAITDHIFADTDLEERLLAEAGAAVRHIDADGADEVVAGAADADALVVTRAPVTADVLAALPELVVVARYGAGYDNVDIDAATDRGVAVVNAPDYCVDEVATHTVALLLACDRRLRQYDSQVRVGEWDWRAQPDVTRFGDATLGLVGFGAVGRAVAERVRGFGVDVLACSASATDAEIREYGAEPADLDALLDGADYVSLHRALTDENRYLIDAAALSRMHEDAVLINTARGGLVDQDALVEALTAGEIAMAGLDVLDPEPPDTDDPLLALDGVVVTPHAAWYSRTAVEELKRTVATDVARALRGERPHNLVNPAALE